jgi:outer membrane protein OmpA-like peptidoglycan-associated protein
MRPHPLLSTLPGVTAAAIAGLLAVGAGAARAEPAPRPEGVDIRLFRPGPGASDYLHVQGGFLLKPYGLTASLSFDSATTPLGDVRRGFGEREAVVSHQSALNLGLGLALADWFEVGLAMPLVVSQGAGAAFGDAAPGQTMPGFAAGDLRLLPKAVLINDSDRFALAIGGELTLPTGSSFAGFGALSGGPQLIIDFQPAWYVRLTANAGARFREDVLFDDLRLGHTFTWGGALQLSFRIEDQLFSVIGSVAGEIPFSFKHRDNDPFEFLGGLSWRGVENLNVFAAMGAGLNRGYGAPDLRGVIGVRWGDFRECIDGPEDLDGWEDNDGCADLDNDLDGLEDGADQCPFEAETRNGWEDADGCPDTLPIAFADLAAMTIDATRLDTDEDGIPDSDDACPFESEDRDGFEDADGCPEPDNDGDGIADVKDICPLTGEVVNGFEDSDGCPDETPKNALVRVDDLDRNIVIADKVNFAPGTARIEKRSHELLEAIAQVLESRRDIALVRIEGHTDSIGAADFNRRLSADRANSVKAWLVARGIDAARLETRGAGPDEPIADNRTAAGRAKNRRVEFRIVAYSDAKEETP